MEKWIISELTSFFDSLKTSFIEKIKKTYKLRKIKRELKKSIEQNILRVYGDEVYYHDFDSFLEDKKFILRILNDLYETKMGEYKAINVYTKILVEEFVQEHPKYVIYKSTFENIIYVIFKCVFDSLNKCDDENARVIVNNTKELIGKLESQIKSITEQNKMFQMEHRKMYDILLELRNASISTLSIDSENVKTGIELYKKSLQTLFYNKKKYIERVLEGEANTRVVDALLENRKIILLGEPGCGKTTEALIVLEEICENTKFNDVIPIYIPLVEYGVWYESIREGICKKLELYLPNIEVGFVNQLLISNKLFLILDGADEIVSLEKRNKFYFDFNELMALPNMYGLLTSRRNQYYGNAKNIREISLSNIDKYTIEQKLRDEGIYGSVVNEFYELFQYPLFLEIGISVLKQHSGKVYNKSQLIEEYINLIFYKRDREKGIYQKDKTNLYEAIAVISELAFKYFEQPTLSLLDFDKILTGTVFSHANICDLFRLDVFLINTDVRFSHRQFKEYFAAFYLVKNISILNNTEKYRELMRREEWQEVLVLACGIFDNIEEQKCFLDELMRINLRTYIRCVRLKNDLSINLQEYSHEEYSRYYLKTLFDSYITIVDIYFPALKCYFNPQMGRKQECLEGKKPCIVGELSIDKKHLNYWFDWTDIEQPYVQLLNGNGREAFEDLEHRAIMERRNISTYGLNLAKGEYEGDSARVVALERIKDDVKNILEKRQLIEDDAILCERLSELKKKVKFIKSSDSIEEMYFKVKEYVDDIFEKHNPNEGELVGIEYNKIDMLNLLDVLTKLYSHNVIYTELVLPQPDQSPNGGWGWDYYSKEQMIKVVEKFFYQAVVSYQNIVEYNFPMMKRYFYRSKDYPLKYRVYVNFKEEEGFYSQPCMAYYYVSTTEDDLYAEVKVTEDSNFRMSDEVFEEIANSYIKNGKEAQNMTITNAGVTMCINESFGKFNNCPLAAYIYKQIKKEFENMFHV